MHGWESQKGEAGVNQYPNPGFTDVDLPRENPLGVLPEALAKKGATARRTYESKNLIAYSQTPCG